MYKKAIRNKGAIKLEESLNRLRKPAIQVVNIFSLLFIFFAYVQYQLDLTLERTPRYLIITTVLALVVNLLGLFQFFEKKIDNPINKAKRYLIVNILSLYVSYLTLYNLYFFVAAEHHYYLDKYWYIGFITLLFCTTMHILSVLLMRFSPKWLKYDKRIVIIILKTIASLIYIQKIIEYIIIPNIANSHFVFLVSILYIFACNFLVTSYYLLYGNVYTETKKQ
ncbi:MFS family permease [Staphylococcus epidermidis]